MSLACITNASEARGRTFVHRWDTTVHLNMGELMFADSYEL